MVLMTCRHCGKLVNEDAYTHPGVCAQCLDYGWHVPAVQGGICYVCAYAAQVFPPAKQVGSRAGEGGEGGTPEPCAPPEGGLL